LGSPRGADVHGIKRKEGLRRAKTKKKMGRVADLNITVIKERVTKRRKFKSVNPKKKKELTTKAPESRKDKQYLSSSPEDGTGKKEKKKRVPRKQCTELDSDRGGLSPKKRTFVIQNRGRGGRRQEVTSNVEKKGAKKELPGERGTKMMTKIT